MGWTQHDAILVTGFLEHVWPVYIKAREIFFPGVVVSPPSPTMENGYQSFCIWPDCSKYGFPTDLEMNTRREKFMFFLRSQNVFYVHVSYGELGMHCGQDSWHLPNESDRIP